MVDLLFVAILVAFFALMVLFVSVCERVVGKDEPVGTGPVGGTRHRRPTPTDHHRGGPGMKSYDNLVGLILSVIVTAYLIYALVAPEKL